MERCERVRDLNHRGEKRPKPLEHQPLDISRRDAHLFLFFLCLQVIPSQKRRRLRAIVNQKQRRDVVAVDVRRLIVLRPIKNQGRGASG